MPKPRDALAPIPFGAQPLHHFGTYCRKSVPNPCPPAADGLPTNWRCSRRAPSATGQSGAITWVLPGARGVRQDAGVTLRPASREKAAGPFFRCSHEVEGGKLRGGGRRRRSWSRRRPGDNGDEGAAVAAVAAGRQPGRASRGSIFPGAVGRAAARRSAGSGRSGGNSGRLRGVGHAAWQGGEEPGRGPPARPPAAAAPSRDAPPSAAAGVASSRRAAERIRWKTLGFSHRAPRAPA